MTDDDVTAPVPGAILHSFLCDYDRLQSLAMLAASHADARLGDVQRLRCLLRLVTEGSVSEAQQDMLAALESMVEQLEARVRDDATHLASALRHPGQHNWPFPARDLLASRAPH